MTAASVRQTSLWALMACEAAFAVILLSGLIARATPPPFVGPAAALAMLPAGYLAVRYVSAVGPLRTRLIVGSVASLLLRLLITWSPESTIVAWVVMAIVPAAIALALWWRGAALAEADLTAGQVRDEFLLLGGGLLVLLSLLRMLLSLTGPPLLLALILFVGSGLLAVGMARQDAAGSLATRSARLLDVAAVAALLALGIVVVGILQPGLVAALWGGVGLLLGALGNLLLLLLGPLLNLFTGLGPMAAPMPMAPLAPGLSPVRDVPPSQPMPVWLAWLLLIVGAMIVLALAAILMGVLLALLSPLWRRALRSSGPEGLVETERGAGEDAQALLAGLRRWLGRFARGTARTLGVGGGRERVADARAAYRALLRWARQEGLDRGSAETTHQFRHRLDERLPSGADAYRDITEGYDEERYGERAVPRARLALLEEHLARLKQLRTTEPGAAPGER